MPVFREDLSLGEDALFNLKFLKDCGNIAVENSALYVYNQRAGSGSLTKDDGKTRLVLSENVLNAAEELANEKGIYLQVRERLWKVYYNSEFLKQKNRRKLICSYTTFSLEVKALF